MNIKIHSSELNRMMKTISQCVDEKFDKFSNIEICHENNLLTIRGTNGQFAAVMSTPLLGGDGESFCVDGVMFARVCGMCSGEVSIITDGTVCTIKGAGRTRIPIVKADVPEFKEIPDGQPEVKVSAKDFSFAYGCVSHAISKDQSRLVLTGVLTEVDDSGLRMTTLDGFRMAIETVDCDGDDMKIVIPGSFMKLIQTSATAGETITMVTDGKKVQASTDGMKISCGLIAGEYPDVARIVPSSFNTECLVSADKVASALKTSGSINSKNNLVKMVISGGAITVMSNSEKADFDAEIPCETQGDGLTIAFNQSYLMDTIGSIVNGDAVMKFGTPSSPCVVQGKGDEGIRLILPVRVVA